MIKHIIIWKLKEEIDDKIKRSFEIKESLEGLVGKIDGLIKMEINFNKLDSSSGDLLMLSEFENVEALKRYQKSKLHLDVANGLVRPSVIQRLSFDYEK